MDAWGFIKFEILQVKIFEKIKAYGSIMESMCVYVGEMVAVMIGADRAKKCKFMENKTGNLKKKDNTTLLALL